MLHEHIRKLKKHRNVLYGLVFILLVLNLVSFLVLSSRIIKLQTEIEDTKTQMQNKTQNLLNLILSSEEQNQKSFNEISLSINEISNSLVQQQSKFEKEISYLKSSQGDFSGVVSEAIKGVVTVRTDKGIGSGFIIHPEGYIVTNYHVIANANRLAIINSEKEMMPAEVIGFNWVSDVAVIKIEGKHPYLELADSDNLKPGSKVIAIGNPLGLSFTVTEGIVSAVKRVGLNSKAEYIQTDVSLNPGNSGGPLIDVNGKVVGINNFKIGEAENLGFALESNALKNYVNEIVNSTLIK